MAIPRHLRSNRNDPGFVEVAAIVLMTASLLEFSAIAALHMDVGASEISTVTSRITTEQKAHALTMKVSSDDIFRNSGSSLIKDTEMTFAVKTADIQASRTYIQEVLLKSKCGRRKLLSAVKRDFQIPSDKYSVNVVVNDPEILSISSHKALRTTRVFDAETSTRSIPHFQSRVSRRSVDNDSCPNEHSLETCVCNGSKINCDNQINPRFKLLFHRPLPTKFKNLSASGSSLREIPSFSGMTVLNELHLSNNKIEVANVTMLKNCPMLEELDLTDNMLQELNLSQLELPNLSKLSVSSNRLIRFEADIPSLTWLYLDRNFLSNIFFVSNLRSLETINLSHNHISHISNETFKHLNNLSYLYLSNNQIANADFLYSITRYLGTLDLSNNKISVISPVTFAESAIVNLYLQNNSLTNVDFLIHMNNLAELNLNYNEQLNINEIIFRSKSTLKKMDLSATNLTSIDFVLQIPSLIGLGINKNNITCLPRQFFIRYTSLRNVYLDDNPMKNLFCPAYPFFDEVVNKCNVRYKIHKLDNEVEVFMKHDNTSVYLNCVLRHHRKFLETCEQKCNSGVHMLFPSFVLTIAVVVNVL